MPALLGLAGAAIGLSHLLGLVLLLYSLEKVSGVVSRTLKRVAPWAARARTRGGDVEASPSPSPELMASPAKTGGNAHSSARSKGWVRGCACPEGCVCANRWVPASRSAAAALAAGTTSFRLAVPCPADLAWHDVTCVVTDAQTLQQKQVLHPCSGIAVPGETMALMGPSGAGKSTLLDLLAGRKAVGRLGGCVLMNGRPCGTLFKRISAYVAQEDVFVPTMTATETLVFHATLTLPSAVDGAERAARIDDVLRLMGLWRARNTQVGGALPGGILVRGLSGGEKRRLNIGCALIASPSLLFLDEPTTGLDSFAALNVMEHMRDLAAMGHTVIASIHQPRAAIWEMFHKVTVLSEGYQLYFGRPEDARAWFGDALGYDYDLGRDGAVSDWMMDLVSVGFAKPPDYAGRSMSCVADVVAAYRAFQRERPPVTDAVLRTVSTLPAAGMKSLAAHTTVSVTAAANAAAAARASSTAGGVGSFAGAGAMVTGRSSAATTDGVFRGPSNAGGPASPLALRVTTGGMGGGPIDRLRSEALAEVAAKSPKAVTDRLQWASGRYAASWWTQFRTLFKRAVLAQLRNPTDATSRLLLATWVGMLGGLVFFNLPVGPEAVQKRLAVLFFTLLLFELVPFCYMSFYVEDRRFFAADVASDLYHPSAYYMATVIAGVPSVVLNSLAGSLSAYGLAGLRPDPAAVAASAAVVIVQSLISIQLQVFCVWLTPNQDLAYVLATGYVAASILLSGFLLRTQDMKLPVMRWLSYASYTKYAMEGVSRLELAGVTWDGCAGGGADLLAGLREATAEPASSSSSPAPAPAPAAPAPGSLAALAAGGDPAAPAQPSSSGNGAPAQMSPAAAAALGQLQAYVKAHPEAEKMYERNPEAAQKWLTNHGYGLAVEGLKAQGGGLWGPAPAAAPAEEDDGRGRRKSVREAWGRRGLRQAAPAPAAASTPDAALAAAAAMGGAATLGGAALPALPAGTSLSDLRIAAGGSFAGCESTGDSILAFWGYSMSLGVVMAILGAFYLAFHAGSYLALSKLYKQKR